MQTNEMTDSTQAQCYRKAKCHGSEDQQCFLPSQPGCRGQKSQIPGRRTCHSHGPAPPVIHAMLLYQQCLQVLSCAWPWTAFAEVALTAVLMVGLNNLEGIFQPKGFYDSILWFCITAVDLASMGSTCLMAPSPSSQHVKAAQPSSGTHNLLEK